MSKADGVEPPSLQPFWRLHNKTHQLFVRMLDLVVKTLCSRSTAFASFPAPILNLVNIKLSLTWPSLSAISEFESTVFIGRFNLVSLLIPHSPLDLSRHAFSMKTVGLSGCV